MRSKFHVTQIHIHSSIIIPTAAVHVDALLEKNVWTRSHYLCFHHHIYVIKSTSLQKKEHLGELNRLDHYYLASCLLFPPLRPITLVIELYSQNLQAQMGAGRVMAAAIFKPHQRNVFGQPGETSAGLVSFAQPYPTAVTPLTFLHGGG